jgi:hypothetical protein
MGDKNLLFKASLKNGPADGLRFIYSQYLSPLVKVILQDFSPSLPVVMDADMAKATTRLT